MAWTTPKTWAVNEPLTAADLNTYVRDNMLAVFGGSAFDQTNIDLTALTTTSTSWTNAGGALTCKLTPTGERVLVLADVAVFMSNTAGKAELRLACTDGTTPVYSDTFCRVTQNRQAYVTMAWLFDELTPNTEYTFSVQFRVDGTGTVTINYSANSVGASIFAMEA